MSEYGFSPEPDPNELDDICPHCLSLPCICAEPYHPTDVDPGKPLPPPLDEKEYNKLPLAS